MKVIIKEVGKVPYVKEIENELSEFQSIVGGYIEAVHIGNGCMMICNEEGKRNGLPYNFDLGSDKIVGTVLFAQTDGEDFASLTEKDMFMIAHFFDRTPFTT